VPDSAIFPLSITMMRSACFMVDRRWAIIIVVRFFISLSMACWIVDSVWVSRDDVGSSRMSIAGLASRARVMDMI